MGGGAAFKDVRVRDACPQYVRCHVDEIDAVGGGDDGVGNGFVLSDAGGGFNGTAEAVDVLHVERGDYVDAGVE